MEIGERHHLQKVVPTKCDRWPACINVRAISKSVTPAFTKTIGEITNSTSHFKFESRAGLFLSPFFIRTRTVTCHAASYFQSQQRPVDDLRLHFPFEPAQDASANIGPVLMKYGNLQMRLHIFNSRAAIANFTASFVLKRAAFLIQGDEDKFTGMRSLTSALHMLKRAVGILKRRVVRA